jgi:peptide-methionine (S)-S-oxide reductase
MARHHAATRLPLPLLRGAALAPPLRPLLAALAALLTVACSGGVGGGSEAQTPGEAAGGARLDTAVFAGGCFWCVEEAFDAVPGVVSTTSGYTGGHVPNPTYRQVSAGGTGHVEVVRVVYDPDVVGYAELLDVFWRNIDPLTPDRQFCDAGAQYRSAIFTRGPEQRRLAEASKRALQGRFRQPIATELHRDAAFYPAEEYHQDYYRKNPVRYRYYKRRCGREQRLREVWGPPR